MHKEDGMVVCNIYVKVVIVLLVLPLLLAGLSCLEASPNTHLMSRPHVSFKDPVLIAGVFHYLDVMVDGENEHISIIAYSGDILPEPENRSVKNYYRWEYTHGCWTDASGHESSSIVPSKCTKENNTYSFCIGLSDTANPGSWTIKIFVDDKETASSSVNVIIGNFCLFFSTIIGVFEPSLKGRGSLVEKELIGCYQPRKMLVSEENIDKIVDEIIRKKMDSSKEEKTVNSHLDFSFSNSTPLTKNEQIKSTVVTYPRSKLKDIKNERTSFLFFNGKRDGGSDFYHMKFEGYKRFFVIFMVFIFFSASLIPMAVLPSEYDSSVEPACIDVHSYSTVNGQWMVMFTTVGLANLTITAVNGTTWDNTEADSNLRFLELRSDNETVECTWENESVFIANYSSDQECYELSEVITPGVHTLMFCFGNDAAFVNDSTSEYEPQTNNNDFQNGTENNGTVYNDSFYVNETDSVQNTSFSIEEDCDTEYNSEINCSDFQNGTENNSTIYNDSFYVNKTDAGNWSSSDVFENTSTSDLSNMNNTEFEDNYLGNNITDVYDTFWEEKVSIYNGAIGSVEMDYTKAWNYFLGHVTWNIQAKVDDNWQNINGLTIDYVNLTEDNRKFSLDFTATIQPQADYRLTLTIDIPVDDYSFDSKNTTFNLLYTVFGHKFICEYNYSDIAALPGLIFSDGVSNGKFWFSIQKNNIPYGTHVSLDPQYGLTGEQTISTYEWNDAEGRTPVAVRLGNSEFYLIAAAGDLGGGTTYDGWIYTIRVSNNSGLIQQSLVDSYEYDASDGYLPAICHVSGDIYAITYRDATAPARRKVITVEVWSTNGTIRKSIIDTLALTYDSGTTSRADICSISNNIYAIAYTDTTSGDGFIETVYINPTNGNIGNAVNDSVEFDTNDALNPNICLVDSDTIAIAYDAGAAGGNDGYLSTWNISSTGDITNTYADFWEFDPGNGQVPFIIKISSDIYAIAYRDGAGDGRINTTTVDSAGKITKSWVGGVEFDTADCQFPYIFRVSNNSVTDDVVYGISYQWSSADGATRTLSITNAGVVGAVIDTLEFNIADCISRPTTIWVSGYYYLTVYESTGNDGWSCTYAIYMNFPPQISDPYPSDGATDIPTTPQLSVNLSDIGDSLNVVWSSNSSGSWQQFGINNSLPSYARISDTTVSTFEYNPNEGRYPDAIQLGTSEYYLIAAAGDLGGAGATYDGWIYTIRIWNNNGTIQQSRIDSWEYDNTDGYYPSISHVSGDIYAISYRDSGADRVKAVTVKVWSTNGTIKKSLIDTQSLTYDGQYCNMISLENNIYAIAYSEVGTGGAAATNDGFIETIYINPTNGDIGNAVNDTVEFNTSEAIFPKMTALDSDTISIVYCGGTAGSNDGYICTHNISSTGDISGSFSGGNKSDEWEFDTSNGQYPFIYKINGNVYAIAYRDSSGDGQIKTCSINTNGVITKSWVDSYEFDTADCAYPYIIYLSGTLYAITYQGTSADGFIKTVEINSSGNIGYFEFDSLEFDTADSISRAPIVSCGNDYYLIVYEGTGNDGWSCTVQIQDSQIITVKQTNSDFSAPGTKYYWRVNATDGANTNSVIYSFTTDGTPPTSSVDAISPYWKTISLQTITSTASDTGSGLKNVTLYYYNSTNNNTWSGPWTFGSTNNTPWITPINWHFPFPNGTGYYRFYSVAYDNATNKEVFTGNDTECGYDRIPTITNPGPSNESTDVILIPQMNITVNDLDGNPMTIIWYSNSSGSWTQFGINNSCSNNTYHQINSNFASWDTTYWWYVNVSDGMKTNTSDIYHFTTSCPPSLSNPDPGNETNSVPVSPVCTITVSDNDGGTVTVKFFENTTGVWKLQQTNSSVDVTTPATVIWNNYSNASEFNTRYWWKVNVTDSTGLSSEETYYFTTAIGNPPIQFAENPTDTSTNISLTNTNINVTIEEPDGETFDWTIETNPDIGSNSGSNEGNGSKTCAISGLIYGTTYTWYVNATDGTDWSNETYTFTTSFRPELSNPGPSNESSGKNLTPTCNITASDNDRGTVNVSFYENTTGIWKLQQTNSSIEVSTPVNVIWTQYTNATQRETIYWWKVNITDNDGNSKEEIYHFTTTKGDPPQITLVNPAPNGTANVAILSPCRIWANDTDGDDLTVYWYENSTGSYQLRATYNNNVSANSTTGYIFSQFSDCSKTYYWEVVVNDSYYNMTATYFFTTESNTLSEINNPSPGNGSTNIAPIPWTNITITDMEGDTMTIIWYSNSSGSWVQYGSNTSCSNGTYRQRNSNFSNYSKTYWWNVTVNDGKETNTSWYYFTTRAIQTSVDTIIPYEQTISPLSITATGDSNLDNVSLWYRWSENNVTWFDLPLLGDITDAVVSTFEWDQQEGRYPDVCRVNNSEFYLIAACGDSGSDYDGWAKTIQAYDDNGTIKQSVISSYEYDDTDGYYPSIVHLPGTDKYAIAYRDTTGNRITVVTLQVSDATGAITASVIDSQTLTYNGSYTNMILVSRADTNRLGWVFAIAYQEVGTGGAPSTGDGFMETIWINKTGTINDTVLSTREFDPADCLDPRLLMVDDDTIAVCYTMTSSDGNVSTWNITSDGTIAAIKASGWEYDASNGQYPGFIKIDGNVFAVAYRDTDTYGYVKTFTIADTGTITKSFIDTLTFTGTMVDVYNYIFPVVSGSVYGISFQGLNADGYIYTMNIGIDGTIGDAIIDSIEFDAADNAFIAPVIDVNENYFLVVYQGTGADGWSCTVEINSDEGWIEWNDASNPDTIYPWGWNFDFPYSTGYYEFYSIGKKTGSTREFSPTSADSICYYHLPPIIPVINSYDLRNASGSKLNNATGLLDVNKEFYFTINITDDNGWSDIDYIEIQAWYDNGSDSTTYNNSGNLGGNLNMYLQYVNTTGVASWSMLWPDDEAQLISQNCTETIIDSTTRTINLSFIPLSQIKWASSNNTWDSTQNICNDPYSWNFIITVTGATGLTSKRDEYGVYKFSSLLPEQNWVDVIASPGYDDTSSIVTITYASNYNFNMSLYFEENLTNETSGAHFSIANNVYILANTDLNDDITADKMFTGIGGANAIDIFNDSGYFHTDNISQTVDVQFNVYIPFGTIGGKYIAHVAIKIKND